MNLVLARSFLGVESGFARFSNDLYSGLNLPGLDGSCRQEDLGQEDEGQIGLHEFNLQWRREWSLFSLCWSGRYSCPIWGSSEFCVAGNNCVRIRNEVLKGLAVMRHADRVSSVCELIRVRSPVEKSIAHTDPLW